MSCAGTTRWIRPPRREVDRHIAVCTRSAVSRGRPLDVCTCRHVTPRFRSASWALFAQGGRSNRTGTRPATLRRTTRFAEAERAGWARTTNRSCSLQDQLEGPSYPPGEPDVAPSYPDASPPNFVPRAGIEPAISWLRTKRRNQLDQRDLTGASRCPVPTMRWPVDVGLRGGNLEVQHLGEHVDIGV